MLRYLFIVIVLLAAAVSSGCTFVALEAIDRVDHAVSKFVQADCELVRIVHAEAICQEPEQVSQDVYCYRRLGGVDCYGARDPIDQPIVGNGAAKHVSAARF